MTGLWMLTAVVCAAEAIWLKQWRPVRVPSDLAPVERMRGLPLPLILEMLSVAIRQGSSIPRALIAVGDIAAGEFGAGLRSAGEQLNEGVPWDDAWPDDGDLAVVRDAFASSWHSGASPVERLETAVEQLDWDERAQIEQAAAICLLDARMRTLTAEPEEGAATAEYAVVLVAATGFAAVLVGIMKSDAIKTLLTNIIKKALSVG